MNEIKAFSFWPLTEYGNQWRVTHLCISCNNTSVGRAKTECFEFVSMRAWSKGYSQAFIYKFTFLSRMLMKRSLWRGASPAPVWLGLNKSLCSTASKRWKPFWTVQKREIQQTRKIKSYTAHCGKSFDTGSLLFVRAILHLILSKL